MNYKDFKKPVLLVGGGVRTAGAAEMVVEFALSMLIDLQNIWERIV